MSSRKKGEGSDAALTKLEEQINVLGRAVFGSENFGKVMHSSTAAGTRIQKAFSNRMAKNLHFYNMPTQDDLTAIAEQCDRMEERMVRIETALTKLVDQKQSGGAASTSAIPRTRKRVAKKPAAKAKTTSKTKST